MGIILSAELFLHLWLISSREESLKSGGRESSVVSLWKYFT